ncbi:hypothetical protein NQD34_007586, partial [Periophthalmus magnuspinnatus]
RLLLNTGELSFTSKTFTVSWTVPVLAGFAPSIADKVRSITDCFSRSSVFCNTSSALTLWSPASCTSNEKYSFGLN